MSRPYWVLDSGALMAYAHGVEAVGQLLVDVADADVEATVAVPLTVLGEEWEIIEVSSGNRPALSAV